MGYAIFRAEKRKAGGTLAMGRHALREGKPVPNAVPGAPAPEVLAGVRTTREITLRLRELEAGAHAAGQRLRDNNTRSIDMLFTYTPGELKSRSDQDEYFRRCVEWVRSTWPTAEILTAAVHRDETTPHLQLLMAPLDAHGKFNAKALMGGPGMFHSHQNSFWLSCGQPHGLERGEPGSTAGHIKIKQFYGHMATAENDQSIQLETVPDMPKLSIRGVADGSYQAAKEARRAAQERNQAKLGKVQAMARRGLAIHPAVMERQSSKYREIKRLEAVVKADKAEAQKARQDAQQALQKAAQDVREVQAQAQAADGIWTKSGAQILDKWTRTMAPEMVQRVARQLGIELVAGRPLLDQMRRQGRGRTLIECAQLLDKQIDGQLAGVVQRQEQQRDRERGG
jgi:Plasmid recombination enzyme